MYGKKRFVRKRPAKGKRSVSGLLKKPATQITTLAKAVKALQMRDKRKAVYLNYSQLYDRNVSGDVEVFKLCTPALNWVPIFGTAADDATGNAMIHKSIGIDFYLTLENTINEPDTTQFTMFLVSLKDDAQTNTFDSSNGNLALAAGSHYVIQNGQVLVNKKLFNIHGIKRKVLTNYGSALTVSAAQSQNGTNFRCYMKVRPNKRVNAPYGNWKDLNTFADPSKCYYILLFNDNSLLDLQNPKCKMTIVHTVEQLA